MPVFALAALVLIWTSLAHAAVLVEAESQGEPIRLVIDWQTDRVRVDGPDGAHLIDLEGGWVYRLGGQAERIGAFARPGHLAPPPWRLEQFGPGPIRAGHATVYHVLFQGEQVCAEILASPWMLPFTDPGVQALALLDRLKGGTRTAAVTEQCGEAPITTIAAAGWPLLVGKVDRPTFRTRRIDFEYQPAPDELAVPAALAPPPSEPQSGEQKK